MKTLLVRSLVFVGTLLCRFAVDFAGNGRIDVEVIVNSEDELIFLCKCLVFFGVVGITIGGFFLALLLTGELS